MRITLQTISCLALAGTILPAGFYYTGQLELSGLKQAMLFATIFWFVVTSLWMGRETIRNEEST